MNKNEIQFNLLLIVLGILFFALAFKILNFRNSQIEAQCFAKGGQVIATPGHFSSCLYSAK